MPGWYKGYLGLINSEIGNDWDILNNFSLSEMNNNKKLDCFIQLYPIELTLDDDVPLVSGIVFYEYLRKTKSIIKDRDKMRVIQDKEVIDTAWSNFWFTTKSYIIVESKHARLRLFKLIRKALSLNERDIIPVGLNLEDIFNDYPSQWLGGFRDRQGHIHAGSLYGEDIINDPEVGDAYIRTRHKNQVGFLTDYFGPEVKIRVTNEGFIQVYGNFDNNTNEIFQFIRDELSQYIQDLA